MSESHDEPVVESEVADSTQESTTEESVTTSELSIEDIAKERDEFKDIALRVQADFENYRKRAATQMSDELDRTLGKLVEQLLPVLDACEAAVAHGVEGVEQVWSSLLGALQKQGLEALDLADKPFDPALADAVLHEEGDGSEPVVLEVLRTGYRWKGRVLRAAMVKVKG
jgi:molecular chaperone GrpE